MQNANTIEWMAADRCKPYGAPALLRVPGRLRITWLTVLTTVEDPAYLDQPFITSTHFKREADSSKWGSPC